MKQKKHLKSATVAGLVAAAIALCYVDSAQASTVSDPVTASKWTVSAGVNTLSAPAHRTPVFSGKVTNVSGDVVTVDGSLTASALDKVNLAGSGVYAFQYVLAVRHDTDVKTNAVQTLDYVAGPGTQGDWFTVENNTTSTVTITPDGFGTTAQRVESGDIVEIYKLINLKELFGSGPAFGNNLKVAAESEFDDTTGDQIYNMLGVGYNGSLTYHDGSLTSEGWWLNFGVFLGDGANFTFAPDEAVRLFRNGGGSFDVTLTGVLQAYNLSHYVVPGFNPLSTGYAAPSPIGATRLLESGFAPEPDFDDANDITYTFLGVGYGNSLTYHDGGVTSQGWWVNFGSLNPAFPLDPGLGFTVKTAGSYVWRQNLPFVP